MGGSKDFKARGVFQYKAEAVIDGIKVLVGNGNDRNNLPRFAGKSLFYAKAKDGIIQQIMVYRNGEMVKRIETEHRHINKTTGQVFEKKDIHIQDFVPGTKKSGRDTTRAPKSKLEKALAKLIGRKVP